jgi:thiamine pyrophosphate-dependent acetolactate synthase large subunit-like protein
MVHYNLFVVLSVITRSTSGHRRIFHSSTCCPLPEVGRKSRYLTSPTVLNVLSYCAPELSGERLAGGAPDNIESLLEEGIDLVIAAGTSLNVHPAAEWVNRAQADGASIVIIDLDQNHQMVDNLETGDLFLKKDITIVLPEVLNVLQHQWNVQI